jgi:hypothetical protein
MSSEPDPLIWTPMPKEMRCERSDDAADYKSTDENRVRIVFVRVPNIAAKRGLAGDERIDFGNETDQNDDPDSRY